MILVAEKKYPGDPDGVKRLEGAIIEGDGPGSSSPSSVSDYVDLVLEYTKLHLM